jgi:CRP-like cAMP-binding protein
VREGDPASQFYIILHGSCSVIALKTKPSGATKFSLLDVLRQGDSFGELGLISGQPRAASVLCREHCHLAVLQKSDYQIILEDVQSHQLKNKLKALENHTVFSRLPSNDLHRLSSFCQYKAIHWKQSLFCCGQRVPEIYILLEGNFQASKGLPEAGLGRRKPKELGVLKAGETLGARSALEDRPMDYTCTCMSALGLVLCLSVKNLRRVVHNSSLLTQLVELDSTREAAFVRQAKALISHQEDLDKLKYRPVLARSQTLLDPPQPPHRGSIIDRFLRVASSHANKAGLERAKRRDASEEEIPESGPAKVRRRPKKGIGRNESFPMLSTTIPY